MRYDFLSDSELYRYVPYLRSMSNLSVEKKVNSNCAAISFFWHAVAFLAFRLVNVDLPADGCPGSTNMCNSFSSDFLPNSANQHLWILRAPIWFKASPTVRSSPFPPQYSLLHGCSHVRSSGRSRGIYYSIYNRCPWVGLYTIPRVYIIEEEYDTFC